MTRHTTALAQQLVWELRLAHCRDHPALWTRLEAGYAAAETYQDAQQHLQACRDLCEDCPVLDPCAERARLDRYTGLAAGTAWRNGHPGSPRAAS